ncbi:hypothetical protein DDB_G0292026 [Dictyostelium discoideum AX4]|nr:hypothetical protein DDB_G0292026 [Dictyostelium discoideum AX4]EAL61369.1 hypothetical protein DDB_G0292026 [Dictyostelium discoideum AX4]|eukprot:XP_629775.1 hypothetical protein DDB_G0292026 [Dictyostelium discoideum AX4]
MKDVFLDLLLSSMFGGSDCSKKIQKSKDTMFRFTQDAYH